jgi:3-deoxy-D-manno-octulosonate 8-phosphate phosphatase (KDO 8-P phosphatase)
MSDPVVRAGARKKAARVTLVLFDVDGVLTDGKISYDADGREIKTFHVRDGHGIKMLQQAGVEVGIITGRRSAIVETRARELGVALVRQGVSDKVAAWRDMLEEKGLAPAHTAYVGDDILDVPLLRAVGFAAAVGDAEACVMRAADYVAGRPGGKGAVRDIAEFILRARGSWEAVTAELLGPRDDT